MGDHSGGLLQLLFQRHRMGVRSQAGNCNISHQLQWYRAFTFTRPTNQSQSHIASAHMKSTLGE